MKRSMTVDEYKLAAQPKKAKTKGRLVWLAEYRALCPQPRELLETAAQQRALFDAHGQVVYRLWLPLAPSANHTKIIRQGKGKAWLADSAAAEAYREAVGEHWLAHWQGAPPYPLKCRLRVLLTIHLPRNGGDIFNREKACLDALVHCGAIADDEQVDFGGVARGKIITPYGAMSVILETL